LLGKVRSSGVSLLVRLQKNTLFIEVLTVAVAFRLSDKRQQPVPLREPGIFAGRHHHLMTAEDRRVIEDKRDMQSRTVAVELADDLLAPVHQPDPHEELVFYLMIVGKESAKKRNVAICRTPALQVSWLRAGASS
jgi:hypothetical protein